MSKLIRLTFKDGRKFFVNENSKSMVMVEDIEDAFKYQSTLEFKVTWKLVDILSLNKEDVVKFQSIDSATLKKKTFDVKENEIKIDKILYVDPIIFNSLLKCGITCSHWLYDTNDKWIAFPEEKDYKKIFRIKYYERGLTYAMDSKHWLERYEDSWHAVYELRHELMLNPIIQQIYLLDLDSCHEFTIYKKELY